MTTADSVFADLQTAAVLSASMIRELSLLAAKRDGIIAERGISTATSDFAAQCLLDLQEAERDLLALKDMLAKETRCGAPLYF